LPSCQRRLGHGFLVRKRANVFAIMRIPPQIVSAAAGELVGVREAAPAALR
jgi:hypothetical protein